MFAQRVSPDRVSGARHLAKTLAEATLPQSIAVWRGPSSRRRVALTFDDGPTELTPAYLDLLESAGARATFFVIGDLCAKRPDLAREIADRGHELAGHGYTHRRFPLLSKQGLLKDELRRTATLLPPATTRRPLVRPPHGDVSLMSLATCAQAGFTTVFWSLDSQDWRTKKSTEVVAAVTGREVAAGTIVLFHDGQSWTLEAMSRILVELKDAGHELVTVGELLG
jgi:peptidoglycan/xylan/chitin deacetylase (PgdA/CDA1 family)